MLYSPVIHNPLSEQEALSAIVEILKKYTIEKQYTNVEIFHMKGEYLHGVNLEIIDDRLFHIAYGIFTNNAWDNRGEIDLTNDIKNRGVLLVLLRLKYPVFFNRLRNGV